VGALLIGAAAEWENDYRSAKNDPNIDIVARDPGDAIGLREKPDVAIDFSHSNAIEKFAVRDCNVQPLAGTTGFCGTAGHDRKGRQIPADCFSQFQRRCERAFA
jgi:dihydrodipicolinate reductase